MAARRACIGLARFEEARKFGMISQWNLLPLIRAIFAGIPQNQAPLVFKRSL